jgi:bifunctional non-homologous end joining protein LigD
MASARQRHRIVKPAVPGSHTGLLPDFVAPCLALRQKAPPKDDRWVHEIKFDGYRLQARLEDGKVKLLTRNSLDWTARFPRIKNALAMLDAQAALLDGEVVVELENGTTSFSELVADLKARTSARMVYYVFDILHLNGIDLRGAALIDRKATLAQLLKGRKRGAVRFSAHRTGSSRCWAESFVRAYC